MRATQALLQQLETNPKPGLNLRQFAGEWVVLRQGDIIAHGADPAQLVTHIHDGDAVMSIGHSSRSYFF